MGRIDAENAFTIEGEAEATDKVKKFIEKATASLETEGEIQARLRQASKLGEGADVLETVYAYDEPIDAFVKEIVDAAMEDAEGIGRGSIKYTVQVEGVKGRATFTLKIPRRDDEDEEDIDYAPVKRGLIAQQMEHNQVILKLAVGGANRTIEQLTRQLEMKDRRIAVLEQNQRENFKMLEEVQSMKMVRDIEMARFGKQEQRKDKVAHVLIQGLPLLAAKLLGGGKKDVVAAGAHTQLEQMLEGLIMTFDKAQLDALMQSDIFTMEQKMAFGQMIQYIIERSEAEKAKEAATSSGGPTNGVGAVHEGVEEPRPETQAAP